MKSLVSVITPVYNREKFIAESIQSILDQTYQNFELIVVDDASTDATVSIINEFEDSRIRLIEQSSNKGVSAALNLGFENARGEYLARLDSDDIAQSLRIEKQIDYLENNPDMFIVGSWLKYMDSNNILKFPINYEEIKSLMLLRCPISIGTAMFRKEVFDRFRFNESLRFGEDYDFWSRVLFSFKASNLQEVLVYYRYHENQLSLKNKPKQIKDDLRLQLKLFQKLDYDQDCYKDELILKFLDRKFLNYEELLLINRWLDFLKKRNNKIEVFPQKEFLSKLKHFYNRLYQTFFFHPESSHRKIIQLKALTTLPVKKSLMIITKKIKVWMK